MKVSSPTNADILQAIWDFAAPVGFQGSATESRCRLLGAPSRIT